MNGDESLINDELYFNIDQLNKLLTGSEKFVSEYFKQMENVLSQDEKETDNEIKNLIKIYRENDNNLTSKYRNLETKLSRENCQIFIYGQVSTGKSKIINAILGQEIFQSASAHTTSCFIRISKSTDQHHHIKHTNGQNFYDQLDDLKNEIRNLSTTIFHGQNQLDTNELLSVYLNIPDNIILTSNTEIIDCPGSANKESITNYIKLKGLKADVFISVLNGEITEDEITFFQFQSEQSSKPKIFFLINKWDQAYNDGDDVAEESKTTITNGINEFLRNRLRLSEDEINNQIFFVSALETCRYQQNGRANLEDSDNERIQEFGHFKQSLSQCIDQSILMRRRKYEEELRITKSDIIYTMNQFKIEFRKKRFIENIEVLKKFLENMQTSSRRKEMKDEITNLIDKFRTFEKKCENEINRYQIEPLESELNSLISDNENPFLTLQIKITNFLEEQIKTYKELTKIDLMKSKHELNETIKTKIKLTHIPETKWKNFCNKFTKIFKELRKHFMENLNKTDKKILNENLNVIKSEVDKLITENLEPLFKYLNTDSDKMIDLLNSKIQGYEGYLKNIDNLFK